MPPAVHSRQQTHESKSIHRAHYADIEQPIIHPGPRRNLHSSSIQRSIRKSSQQRRLIAANIPAILIALGSRQNLHRHRRERPNRRSQAQGVPSMPPQPSRQPVRPRRHLTVKPHSRHTAEVSRYRSRPRVIQRRNHSQINCPNIPRPTAKSLPRLQRIPHPPHPQRSRKIVPTPYRHNQHRQAEPNQLRQMPMNEFHPRQITRRHPPRRPIPASPFATPRSRPTEKASTLSENTPARE